MAGDIQNQFNDILKKLLSTDNEERSSAEVGVTCSLVVFRPSEWFDPKMFVSYLFQFTYHNGFFLTMFPCP